MRSQRHAWIWCVLFLIAGTAPGCAQTAVGGIAPATIAPATIAPATEDALHAMTQMAAVIFAGQVVAIRLPQRAGGVVEIDFAVEDAIRGVSGGTYVLREWGGLWAAGNEPLRVGQRYLMLLHAPGPAGLSSPVGGTDGAIPILGGEARAADGRVVDLRWVATRVARTVAYGAEPVARSTLQPVALRADVRAAQVDVAAMPSSGDRAARGAAYAAVMGALRGWERDAAR